MRWDRDMALMAAAFCAVALCIAVGSYFISQQKCYSKFEEFERTEFGLFSGCRVEYRGRLWPSDRVWAERPE